MTIHLIKALIEIAVLITLWRISVHQDDRITVLEEKEKPVELNHTCGSWPDSHWTREDFKNKDKAMKKCLLCNPPKEKSFASKKKAELKRISKVQKVK
jgi:hypothetical protein